MKEHPDKRKQNLAIAYAIKRKAMKKKMAHGGDASCYMEEGGMTDEEMDMMNETSNVPSADKKTADSFRKSFNVPGFADGGFVGEEEESGYEEMPAEHEKMNHAAEMEDEDMISRIMHQRYSKGGMVANDTQELADFEENEFDDLVKDDHLEFHETGANSGDEDGDEKVVEDGEDMVGRIMKKRKQHNPRPA